MAVKRRRLTDAYVARLAPAAREYTIWDTRHAGLGVRVRPSGHRSFVYRRKGEDGARRITLAPAALTSVEEARAKCLAIETGARPGRPEGGSVPTFADFAAGSGAGVLRPGQTVYAKDHGQGRRRALASGLRIVAFGPDHPGTRDPLVRRVQPNYAGRGQSGVEPSLPNPEPCDRLPASRYEPGPGHQAEPRREAQPLPVARGDRPPSPRVGPLLTLTV